MPHVEHIGYMLNSVFVNEYVNVAVMSNVLVNETNMLNLNAPPHAADPSNKNTILVFGMRAVWMGE